MYKCENCDDLLTESEEPWGVCENCEKDGIDKVEDL